VINLFSGKKVPKVSRILEYFYRNFGSLKFSTFMRKFQRLKISKKKNFLSKFQCFLFRQSIFKFHKTNLRGLVFKNHRKFTKNLSVQKKYKCKLYIKFSKKNLHFSLKKKNSRFFCLFWWIFSTSKNCIHSSLK